MTDDTSDVTWTDEQLDAVIQQVINEKPADAEIATSPPAGSDAKVHVHALVKESELFAHMSPRAFAEVLQHMGQDHLEPAVDPEE
ncbi:MAG: hypothetical protein ACYCZM_14630 [Acidimicrobiales bacterium]